MGSYMSSASALLLLVLLTLVYWLYHYLTIDSKYSHIPSPPSHPLWRNHDSKIGPRPWINFRKWAHEYGDFFHFRLGTEHFVYVNNREAIKELFDKQSAVTSCKGPILGADEIVHGLRQAVMPYGPRWRSYRAAVHKLLTPKMALTYVPSQQFESTQLLNKLLDYGGSAHAKFGAEVQRYTTSIMLTSIYGIRVPNIDDPTAKELHIIMEEFSETTTPGFFVTGRLPWLTYLPTPLQWWRPRALQYYHHQKALWMRLLTELRTKMRDEKSPACFAKDFLQDGHLLKMEFGEEDIAFLAGGLIEGGSETTADYLKTVVLYLAADPDIQKVAQAELDAQVPLHLSRSPVFADQNNLPYINAIIKETMRIQPLTRWGSGHYNLAPVSFRGTTIPAGTYIFINQPFLHMDPAYFPDPDKFAPERYLNHRQGAGYYANQGDPAARDHYVFGAGRRICPGIHIAENSMAIVLAKLLWAFDILPPVDGAKVDTSEEAFKPGANLAPKDFEVRFVVRDEARAAILRREWKDAMVTGYETRGIAVGMKGVVVE